MNEQANTPDSQDALSRRAFLQRVSVLGAAGAGVFLAACGPESAESGAETSAESDAPAAEEPAAGFACGDVSGLTEAEVAAREGAVYVDASPQADKNCLNCNFWQDPQAGAQCGGCQVVKGPIHPQGYCNLWVAKMPTAG